MSKEKENLFEGFDLFNPVSQLKTQNPDLEVMKEEVKKDEVKSEVKDEVSEVVDEAKKEVEQTSNKSSDKKGSDINTDETGDSTDNSSIKDEVSESEEAFSYKPLVQHLLNKGILDVEESDLETVDNSDEEFEKVIDKTINNRFSKLVDDYKRSLPDDLHKLVEFVELGGDPKQFLDVYYGDNSLDKLSLDSEENQKAVIRQSLKMSGWEDVDIEDEISDYEALGKLETKAKPHFNRLKTYEKEQKETLLKIQQQNAVKKQEEVKAYWEDVKKDLFSKEELMGFKVSEKDKKDMWDAMTVVNKKTGMTKVQEYNETNKEAQFLYTYLLTKNFNLDSLKKNVKTQVTSELRKNLGRFTDTHSKISSGRTVREEKSDDAFEAFGKLEKTIKK